MEKVNKNTCLCDLLPSSELKFKWVQFILWNLFRIWHGHWSLFGFLVGSKNKHMLNLQVYVKSKLHFCASEILYRNFCSSCSQKVIYFKVAVMFRVCRWLKNVHKNAVRFNQVQLEKYFLLSCRSNQTRWLFSVNIRFHGLNHKVRSVRFTLI